ncbi:hypothetical protein [Ideonella sp. BN130291]|uniref:hypothetical protein n=1 Tax=Ideonella sp. BN130291 TaxID=3112940 RepID=UPI002E266D0E|nr:hypothetical protein [Ideonella sp. BN130291]
MGIRGLASVVSLSLALLLASCGGGSGRSGTDVVVSGVGPSAQILRGETAVFTMTVANEGDGPATDVTVRNQLAYPLVLDSITCEATGGAVCPSTSTTAPMAIPSLPSGAQLTFTVTTHLASGGGTGAVQVSNTMSASFSADVSTGNNSATATATAFFSTADVVVTGVGPQGVVPGGGTAQFLMTVANNGPDTATHLSIDNNVQGPLTLTGIVCTAVGNAVCPTTIGFKTAVDELPAGSALQFTVSAVATPPRGAAAPFANKMLVTLDNDSDTSNNSFIAEGSAYTAQSGVFVTGVGPTATVAAGTATSFTMTVENSGPDAATNVRIVDSVDSQLVYTGMSCQASGAAVCPDAPGQLMDVPSIPAGGSLVFSVGAVVKSGFNGTVRNTMTATPDNDSNRSDNSAVASGTTVAQDLTVTASAASGTVPGGAVTSFTMTVLNKGPGTATDIAITDTASAGLTLGSIGCAATGGAVCPVSMGPAMTAPSMPVNSTLVFTVQATVAAGSSGALSNTLTASVPGESRPVDNSATATINALSADLGVSQTGAQTVAGGSSAVFTAVVANPGPNIASNITVTQTLSPSGYMATVACAPSSGAACPGTLGTSMTIPSLHAGDYLVLTYTVPVEASKRDAITSTVQIAAAGDTNASNNTALVTTQAVNASSGLYTAFAADGHQYDLNVDFDAGSYTLQGNGQVLTRSFTTSGSDFVVSGSARFRLSTDLIVGGDTLGGSTVTPYIAVRSFATNLQSGGFNIASRNILASGPATHVGTLTVNGNTLAICQIDGSITRASNCGTALKSYTLSGPSGNAFTAVGTTDPNDRFTFVIARIGALRVLLTADKAADGTPQLRIGLPDGSGLADVSVAGASTTGDWVTMALTGGASTYGFTGLSGTSDTASLIAAPTGGPFNLRQGTRASNGQKIDVLQALPFMITVGDPTGTDSGLMQLGIQ